MNKAELRAVQAANRRRKADIRFEAQVANRQRKADIQAAAQAAKIQTRTTQALAKIDRQEVTNLAKGETLNAASYMVRTDADSITTTTGGMASLTKALPWVLGLAVVGGIIYYMKKKRSG